MKKTMMLLALTLACWSGKAWALSDRQYKTWMADSPEFREAEDQLRTVWKTAQSTLPKQEFEVLSNQQNDWVSRQRERLVPVLADGTGMPLPKAYAMMTKDRADRIQNYLNKDARKPVTFTGRIGTWGESVSIFALKDSPAQPWDSLDIAPAGTSINDVLRVCQTKDTCTVTGVLDIEGEAFAAVTQVTLVEKYNGNIPAEKQAKENRTTPQREEPKELSTREKDLIKELDRINRLSRKLPRYDAP